MLKVVVSSTGFRYAHHLNLKYTAAVVLEQGGLQCGVPVEWQTKFDVILTVHHR